MLACLKMGRLEPPFDAHPKDGRLDQLPPHALFAIKTSSEARRLERAAGPTGDWVTDPGVPGARLAGGAAGGSPGLGFKSSKYTAARGGAPILGVSLGRNAKTLEEMLRRSSDDVDGDGEGAAAGAGRSSPSRRVKDVLEIKGDMRDWLGKGAKGELAQKELGAQKERAKELELRLESTELRLKTATDELQRLRDGMVRQRSGTPRRWRSFNARTSGRCRRSRSWWRASGTSGRTRPCEPSAWAAWAAWAGPARGLPTEG